MNLIFFFLSFSISLRVSLYFVCLCWCVCLFFFLSYVFYGPSNGHTCPILVVTHFGNCIHTPSGENSYFNNIFILTFTTVG